MARFHMARARSSAQLLALLVALPQRLLAMRVRGRASAPAAGLGPTRSIIDARIPARPPVCPRPAPFASRRALLALKPPPQPKAANHQLDPNAAVAPPDPRAAAPSS